MSPTATFPETKSKELRWVLGQMDALDPDRIQDYLALDGYEALRKAVTQRTPEEVLTEVKASGLRGRGGGGFLAGRKWELARAEQSPLKYLVCNGDEGDPGAFMDRSLLEGDPHLVLEGMAIAAYAIGATQGYVYVRAEYPLAIERLNRAIEQARSHYCLGERLFGTDFSFDIAVRIGAGAFVCGEETALIGSIEGRRGEPRPRPPYPVQSGLWGHPTVVNNVETFANVPLILQHGAAWFASVGTANSKGTKTFSLAGKIKKPGLIEVPMGTTLREIVFDIGGGIPNRRTFKAAQTGGPMGGCLPEACLDTPIDFESLAAAGSMMGSGGLVVMDSGTCMVDVARFFMEFTQEESCGRCVPCRIGTRQMLGILNKLCAGEGTHQDLEQLEALCETIRTASLCALGQGAPNPILSTLRHFRSEFEAHVYEKRCPAKVCTPLIRFEVSAERCTKCGVCVKPCPTGAMKWHKGAVAEIDPATCSHCRRCIDACRFDAIN
ncbi:MAG TPA: NADH-ubiquinone oxidoreductase-F iron-sulfur binding region domain-containing protein [Stenomitos sp.]